MCSQYEHYIINGKSFVNYQISVFTIPILITDIFAHKNGILLLTSIAQFKKAPFFTQFQTSLRLIICSWGHRDPQC